MTWDDGHISPFPLTYLRDQCPCAECKGETVLLHSYQPIRREEKPGRYELKGMHVVGNYALQIIWGDGHDTGLYSWQYLRGACPCNECSSRRPHEA